MRIFLLLLLWPIVQSIAFPTTYPQPRDLSHSKALLQPRQEPSGGAGVPRPRWARIADDVRTRAGDIWTKVTKPLGDWARNLPGRTGSTTKAKTPNVKAPEAGAPGTKAPGAGAVVQEPTAERPKMSREQWAVSKRIEFYRDHPTEEVLDRLYKEKDGSYQRVMSCMTNMVRLTNTNTVDVVL